MPSTEEELRSIRSLLKKSGSKKEGREKGKLRKKAYSIPVQLVLAMIRYPKKFYRLLRSMNPELIESIIGTEKVPAEAYFTMGRKFLQTRLPGLMYISGRNMGKLPQEFSISQFPHADMLARMVRGILPRRARYIIDPSIKAQGVYSGNLIRLHPAMPFPTETLTHELAHHWISTMLSPTREVDLARWIRQGSDVLEEHLQAAIRAAANERRRFPFFWRPNISEAEARAMAREIINEYIDKDISVLFDLIEELLVRPNPYVSLRVGPDIVSYLPFPIYVLEPNRYVPTQTLRRVGMKWKDIWPYYVDMVNTERLRKALQRMPGSPLVRFATPEEVYIGRVTATHEPWRVEEVARRMFDRRTASEGLEYLRMLQETGARTREDIERLTHQFLQQHSLPTHTKGMTNILDEIAKAKLKGQL